MPSLKDLRTRIGSVKSTRKITSAMKMVAAAKLRRAQEQAEAGQPYAERMAAMLARLAANITISSASPRLLIGTGKDIWNLVVVITSDRGLAGGFNSNVIREAKRLIQRLENEGKDVQVVPIGRKARDAFRGKYLGKRPNDVPEIATSKPTFENADEIANYILEDFNEGKGSIDVAHLVYNRFKSVLAQVPTVAQVIPFALPKLEETAAGPKPVPQPIYEFEPDEETILEELLPRNLAVQLYRALLDSAAGEQAARMTAMDNATRNAGDVITKLTMNYNRARQAYITKELIEIISGAEAV